MSLERFDSACGHGAVVGAVPSRFSSASSCGRGVGLHGGAHLGGQGAAFGSLVEP